MISDSGARAIGLSLEYNFGLVALYLHHNRIGSDGIYGIAGGLKVIMLHFLLVFLSPTSFSNLLCITIIIYLFLQANSSLLVIDLSDNPISNLGIGYLSHAIQSNNSLRALYLANVGVDDEGAGFISDAILSNTVLQVLQHFLEKKGGRGERHF